MCWSCRRYKSGCNPHQCILDGGHYVNEDFQHLSARVVKQVHWAKIVVNHYVTRCVYQYKGEGC